MRHLAFSLLAASITAGLTAQEPLRGPDGGTSYRVTGVELLAVPGKPFSAKTRTDWTRPLEDGNVVALHLQAFLTRDSQGRTYRQRRSFVPDGSDQASRLNDIELFDPQAQTRTTCVVASHRCIITRWMPRTTFLLQPEGPYANNTRYLSREQLGTDTIESLSVIGTRETITVSPGAMGNERALVSTREFWYSPDLETNLSITRKDLREGTQFVHLSAISRSEPPKEIFKVPQGFTVQDDRGPTRPISE